MLCGMSNTTKRIADRVRGVAAEKRFTQAQVAEALGISRGSVAGRMNGHVPFTATELYELAAAMSVPVSRFFPPQSVERAA